MAEVPLERADRRAGGGGRGTAAAWSSSRPPRRGVLRPARGGLAGRVLPGPAGRDPDRQPRHQRRHGPHRPVRPEPAELLPGDPTGVRAGVRQFAPLRGADDRPVDPDRLSDRLLDLALRREAQDPPADPGDAAVLDELSHPDLRLDDHPARQRRAQFDPPDARPDERSDPVPQHRLLGRARDDLRLPAVRDPAAVRLDRPARPQPRPGGARPVRQRPQRVPARHPAADDAGHHRRGAADVHPGDRRLRDARICSAAPRRRRSRRSSRSSSPAAATGRMARRSGSC